MITVKRSTGWMGSATKMQIIVNRERVATINNNQVLDVELPDDKNNLKVRQFGVSSNEIEVRDGDILEVIGLWNVSSKEYTDLIYSLLQQ